MTEKQDQIRVAKKKISVEAVIFANVQVLCRATLSTLNLHVQGENRVKQPVLPGCVSVLMTMIKLSLELQIIME